ncbi:MAG: acetylxylan esterase, partial [Gemmatimonadota bacterium]
DLKEWRRERQRIRQHLLLCAGLNDRTAAFRARGRVVGRLAHEGLVVENLCIETLPGLYLVGNLYRPREARGRLPLVLHPHGHAQHARTVPLDMYSVPHRAMNCALLGCASFSYSMIGYDSDTGQLEHGTLLRGPEKRICNALGLSIFGLQLNNSIKALDYLLSRPDIDPRRVGCTGESGGGTQTYFLAAVDERVMVAAPAVMLSGHFQGGCGCENAPLLHLKYSNLHYAALIAPRPLLLLGCTGDMTHHLRQREYPCLRQLYRRYGRTEAIDCFYQDEQHNYDRAAREAVYAWMVRWLLDPKVRARRLPESPKPVPATARLLVFDRPVPPYRGAISTQKQVLATWRDLHQEPAAPAAVADVLQLELPARDDVLVRSQTPRHAYRSQRDRLHSLVCGRFSEDSSIPCRFLPPRRGARSYLILRGWQDGAAWQRFGNRPPAWLRQLMADGSGVVVPLLFGQALPAPVAAWRQETEESYLSTTYNRTAHAHQAGDILTVVRMAQVELGIAPRSLAVVADREVGLLAYVAWAFLDWQVAAGPFAGDLGGGDLADPATWARRAYFPLLLGAGGLRGLAGLVRRGKGHLGGVRADQRRLFPKGVKAAAGRLDLAGLVQAAGRL